MTLNLTNIKNEVVVFLRNQDILTITQRGVTTGTDTGTFSDDSTHLINVSNGKNVRSITVGGSPLTFGTDYTVDYDFDDSGTIKIKISFTSAQTGDYVISYDYGTDKIYPDFPRDDLTIDSYPRIAIDIIAVNTDAFGIGGSQFISDVIFTVVIYANNVDDIDGYIQSIKDAMRGNAKLFYYVNFIKPTVTGPLINSPDRSNEIMQRNTDFQAMFQEE